MPTINFKMPTIVGILKFLTMTNCMLILVEHKKFYNIGIWFACASSQSERLFYIHLLTCTRMSFERVQTRAVPNYLFDKLMLFLKENSFISPGPEILLLFFVRFDMILTQLYPVYMSC